ncbi:MAG: 1,4-beta-xylanase [Bacteroidetes bacterium]|nr:1,4-beta-xylanase [Bacteroidota bacterium]
MRMLFILLVFAGLEANAQDERWSADKTNKWFDSHPWSAGCNYIPATAINPIEMWQAATFDTATIASELSLAHSIGFNTLRVFLHEVVYRYDSIAYKQRIKTFLSIADRNQIKVMFVLFDDCWMADPHPGPQRPPRPGVHNSEWVQCPGKKDVLSQERWSDLQKYTEDIVRTFANDQRVLIWDVYNEPGNSGIGTYTTPLLINVFQWARSQHPTQPLTSGVYTPGRCSATQLKNSDVISFHNYGDGDKMKKQIEKLKALGRPLICTEYMARTNGSTFQGSLPVLASENVGAINWGFVNGKTQTIYPWSTGKVPMTEEPKVWFHEIFRADHTAYDIAEVELIKKIVKDKNNCNL